MQKLLQKGQRTEAARKRSTEVDRGTGQLIRSSYCPHNILLTLSPSLSVQAPCSTATTTRRRSHAS